MTDTSKVTLNAKQGNNKSNVKIAVINPGYAEISVKNDINTDSTTVPPTTVLALQKVYTKYQQEQKDESVQAWKDTERSEDKG
jgi:FlaG/FlaF family flagellin (archaellin)